MNSKYLLMYNNVRVFLLAVALGLAAVSFGRWTLGDAPENLVNLPAAVPEGQTSIPLPPPPPVEPTNVQLPPAPFLPTGESADGMTDDGGHFFSSVHQAVGSAPVVRTITMFPEEADAKRHLNRYLMSAGRVLLDSRNKNGRDALPVYLVFERGVGKGRVYIVVWYMGGDSYQKVQSTELQTAVRFLNKPGLDDQAGKANLIRK